MYGEGEMSGIYDLEQEGRSVINKLNTNYNCFCVLLRDVNKVLKSQKQTPISFQNSNIFEQLNQVKRFVKIIEERQNLKIGDVYEAAYLSGFIDKIKFKEIK